MIIAFIYKEKCSILVSDLTKKIIPCVQKARYECGLLSIFWYTTIPRRSRDIMMSAEERLRKLSDLYVGGVQNSNGQALSVETLLDVLIVLYDECCNSTLRREKNISEFVDFGKGEIFIHLSNHYNSQGWGVFNFAPRNLMMHSMWLFHLKVLKCTTNLE